MTEDLDTLLAAFDRFSDNKDFRTALERTIIFLNSSKINSPKLKFWLDHNGGSYSIHPIVKLKLTSNYYSSPVSRTITLGHNKKHLASSIPFLLFTQILTGFNTPRHESSNIFRNLNSSLGHDVYSEKQEIIDSMYSAYIKSEKFVKDSKLEKELVTQKIRSRIQEEILGRFRIMLSLGHDEEHVVSLFRQVEIERVLGS